MGPGAGRERTLICNRSYKLDNYLHRQAVVDSGCDTSLKHSICNQFLVNTRPSNLKIYGFAGDTPVRGDLFGTAHVHVISKQSLCDDGGTRI